MSIAGRVQYIGRNHVAIVTSFLRYWYYTTKVLPLLPTAHNDWLALATG